jgi:hypothetical protein
MGIDATIVGTAGRSPIITEYGQLVTGPIDYSKSSVVTMTSASTGYMLIPPVKGKKIVVTSVFARAGSTVSNTVEADILVYESKTATGTTSYSDILDIGLIKQQFINIPMNYLSDGGSWIMCSTSDPTCRLSVFYYYVPI